MKIWRLVFLAAGLVLAAISGWNIFFSRNPQFQNIIYFPASLIMVYSFFYNILFQSRRDALEKQRREENRKREL